MCIYTSIVLCSHVEPLAQFTVVQATCGSHHTMALLQGKEVGSTVHTPVSYQLTARTKHHFNLVLFEPCPLTVCGKHLVSLKHFHGCVVYRIAGNFRGRNFHEFRGFVAIRKSFLHKMCGAWHLFMAPVSNPRKFSLRKSYFENVFSHKCFPL